MAMCRIYIRHTDLNIFQICSRNGGSVHTSANETAVTREDFSSPLGTFLTQIPKPDSKKFYKRVPPKLFSIYSCGVFLIYSCWLNDSGESAEWCYSWGLLPKHAALELVAFGG